MIAGITMIAVNTLPSTTTHSDGKGPAGPPGPPGPAGSISNGDQKISGTKTFSKVIAESIQILTPITIAGVGFDGTKNITKEDMMLNNIDNTRDVDKPISIATQAALDALTARIDLFDVS